MRNSRTPLSSSAEQALERLTPEIEATESGVPVSQATATLADDGFDDTGAREAVTELLQKGYLYEVDDTLHIP